MKYLLLCVGLWALCCSLVRSEDRSIRVLHYGAPKESQLRQVYLYGIQKDPLKIELNRSNFSDKILIAKKTVGVKVLQSLLPPDTMFPAKAPAVTIPEGWTDTLLIFFYDPSNTLLPIRISKINASNGVFSPGEIYWINMSDVMVGGQVGSETLRVGPKETVVMPCPREEVECQVKLDFLIKGEKSPRALIRQTWRVNQTTRQVVFILRRPPPQMASYYVLPLREEPEAVK